MHYKLIRSKRKTISLIIKPSGELVIRAPMRVSVEYIERLILKKSSWIELKRNATVLRFAKKNKAFEEAKTNDPDMVILFGNKTKITFDKNNKEKLIAFYKAEAMKYALPKLNEFSKKFSLTYNKVRISSAKTRFGSCSSRKVVSLSWRLFMAPQEIIDYVIAHEAAHLQHLNHSTKFWNLVEMMLPNYKKSHLWLKEHGFLLDIPR